MSEQDPGKRRRIARTLTDQEKQDSDEFWEKAGYFDNPGEVPQAEAPAQENESEDEGDYEPDPRKLIKISSSSASPMPSDDEAFQEDDIIDSLSMVEDEDDWESEGEQEEPVQQLPIIDQQSHRALARQNLQKFSFMRAVHQFVPLQTLERLGTSSYVRYDSDNTFKPSTIINRFCFSLKYIRNYIGLPSTVRNTGYDEQEFTKTEFHGSLFKLEDQRYEIDFELKQLRSCLRKIEENKKQPPFTSFQSIRRLGVSPLIEKEELAQTIQIRISTLESTKANLKQPQEPFLFSQSIDQKYSMTKRDILASVTPRIIQQDINGKISQIEDFLENFKSWDAEQQMQKIAYFLSPQTALKQCLILDDLIQAYDTEKLLLLPTAIYVFDQNFALSVDLIRSSLRSEEPSQDSNFAKDVFEDLIKGFFGTVDVNGLTSDELITILEEDVQINQINMNNQENIEDFETPKEQSPLFSFYPYSSDCYLIGRPILSYLLSCIHLIHQKVQLIQHLTHKVYIMISDKFLELEDLCFDIVKRSLRNLIPEAQFQVIMRHIFKDEVALQILQLQQLLVQVRRLIQTYQFDDISMQFFLTWVNQVPNSIVAQYSKSLNGHTQEQILEGVALSLRQPRCNMCRIQKIGPLITQHNFDLQKLSEAEMNQLNQTPADKGTLDQ